MVYTLLPPTPARRITHQKVSMESGRPVACPAPVETIQLSRSIMSRTRVSEPIPPMGIGSRGKGIRSRGKGIRSRGKESGAEGRNREQREGNREQREGIGSRGIIRTGFDEASIGTWVTELLSER